MTLPQPAFLRLSMDILMEIVYSLMVIELIELENSPHGRRWIPHP